MMLSQVAARDDSVAPPENTAEPAQAHQEGVSLAGKLSSTATSCAADPAIGAVRVDAAGPGTVSAYGASPLIPVTVQPEFPLLSVN